MTPVDEFGPQAADVRAFLAELETLTPDEWERIATAWLDTPEADLDAAGDAASEVFWNAARYAAWGPPLDLARDPNARVAAWDAVRALVVRDLIGHPGFARENYDTLVGPVCVIDRLAQIVRADA